MSKQPDAAREPSGRERQDGLAGRVEPLHIVDRHQHRRLRRQAVDHRGERRRDDALIGRRPLAARPQQHPVDRDALHLGQLGQHRGVDVAEEVGHRRVGEHGLGLPDTRREHPESALACRRDTGQPQRGLADAGLAVDDEPGRLMFREPRNSSTARNSAGRSMTPEATTTPSQ